MRVLIVEDESRMANLLKRGLEEEGYTVDIAWNGEDGLRLGTGRDYEAIVLDLGLPLRDGIGVCRELRARRVTTPVLMLTARDTVDVKVEGLDSGADDYLTKPFSFDELLARLRALQRRARAEPVGKVQIADMVVDPIARRVTRAGREIVLTPKEYALLDCLIRHRNQVLSRTVLAESAWGESYDALTNVVDVYINYLRNKIDRNFEPKLIHTRRGLGYVLQDDSPAR